MNRTLAVLLLTTSLFSSKTNRYQMGNLLIENIPDIPTSVELRLQPYQQLRSAVFLDWLPGGKGMLIKTRFSETNQVHAIEQPKGMRRQLTFFNEPIGECVVCPDPLREVFLFTKDSAGNEIDQIYKYDLVRGTYSMLSDGRARYNAIVWSRKGDRFSFRSNRKKRSDYDIYIGDLSGQKSFKAVLEEGGYWYPVEFSPDDRKLLVKKYVSSDESYYYILDIANRSLVPLHRDTLKIAYGTARWSPDNDGIYVVADRFSDFRQLLFYDLDKEEFEILTKGIPWDIVEIEIDPSGNTLALTSNEDGYSRLYFLDLRTRTLNRASLPDAQIFDLAYKPGGAELAITVNKSTSPSDVYSLNPKAKRFFRWTYSELGGLDTSSFVSPKLLRYETFDSIDARPRTIPFYYYEPKGWKPPFPVMIDCHGGPSSQEKPYFSYLLQFFCNELGIAVIAPNVRGSSGYGREFMMLDNGYKREDAVKDIGALLNWIEKQPQLDSRRISIGGGSYGGYMALASMVSYSDRLACGIDASGISNFVTFLQNTGEYRRDVRREEYGDERDPEMREFLNRISPLTNARSITKPLFITQGLHDPRVPVSEAEQIVDAVRRNGVDVWYLLAEDEGHGFGKKSNRNFYQQALVLFLQKYLLNGNRAR
ncbi:MAG: S9 family peptidase [candidate division WOR-3 bacterium]|nr:MAG: S9 family peptidase [candidate division WOR-3 bacterium]